MKWIINHLFLKSAQEYPYLLICFRYFENVSIITKIRYPTKNGQNTGRSNIWKNVAYIANRGAIVADSQKLISDMDLNKGLSSLWDGN